MLFEVSSDGAKMLSRDTVVDSLHESAALKEKENHTSKIKFNQEPQVGPHATVVPASTRTSI